MSKKEFIIIDWLESSAALYKTDLKGRSELLKVVDVKEPFSNALKDALLDIFSKETTSKDVICVLPESAFLYREIELPSRKPSEIEEMLRLQIEQHFPYAVDEMYYDYMVSSVNEKRSSNISLLAMSKAKSDNYRDFLQSCGCQMRMLTSHQSVKKDTAGCFTLPISDLLNIPNVLSDSDKKLLINMISSGDLKKLFLCVACVIIILVSGVFYMFNQKLDALSSLQEAASRITSDDRELLESAQILDFASEISDSQFSTLELLRVIHELVPNQIYLTGLDFKVEDKEVVLEGISKDLSTVSDLLLVIQKNNLFKDAEILFAKNKERSGEQIVDFEIKAFFDKAEGGVNE